MKRILLMVLMWTAAAGLSGQTQMDLPVTFDDPTVDYGIVGFEGAEASVITVDPTDAGNTVVEFNKSATAQFYAGVTVTTLTDDIPPFSNGFATAIPITADNTTMTVRTWSPDAGIIVVLKIEDKNDPTRSVQTEAIHTVANGWETLTFDFANEQTGTAALNLSYTFDKATIFFNWAQTGAQAGAKTYYFDDIQMGESVGGLTQMNLPVTFDDSTVDYGIIGFEGAEASVITVDPTDAGNTVVEFNKSETAQFYAGVTLTAPAELGFATPIPLTSSLTSMKVRTWSPDAGIIVVLKIEDHSDPTKSVQTEAIHTVANGWETLTFDFANQQSGTAALNLGYTYDKATIFFNWAQTGAQAGAKTYYFDDIELGEEVVPDPVDVTFSVNMNEVTEAFGTPEVNGTFNDWCGGCAPMSDLDGDGIWTLTIPLTPGQYAYKFAYDSWAGQESIIEGSSCSVTADGFTNRALSVTEAIVLPTVCWGSCVDCGVIELNQMNLPVTFDDENVDYGIVGFEGAEASVITVDPTDAGNTVVEFNKSATAQFYAGVTVTTLTDDIPPFSNGFATAIPITADNTTMTVRTWSPDAGIIVVLKIEDKNDPTRSVQTEAIHTVANGWETLTFDFANEQTGTAALNLGYTYDKATIFFNWAQTGAQAGAKTYYFDDIQMGEGSVGGTFDVTFQVNMNDVTDAFTTPEVNGIFNGWCGGCAPMSDVDGDGIWSITIPLAAGTYEYKYAADSWTIQEALTDGSACTSTLNGFTNRSITVSEDVVLDPVCWGTCNICDTGVEVFDVTFSVNMNDVTEAFTTPEVNGIFNGWCGGCAPMSDLDGDGIWTLTIPLAAGTYIYKYAADSWTIQESLTEGSSCTATADGFTNRTITVDSDITLPVVCWGSCTNCEGALNTYNVTFQVDMSQVTESFTTPEINGTFNGWCGGCAPMSDIDGDGIWTITIPLQEGNYEFKFAADSWNIQEELTPGSSCTVTADGFTNRSLEVSAEATLDVVCWASCTDCGSVVPNQDVTFQVDMNQVTEAFTTPEVFGSFNGWCSGCNPLSDDDGDGVWSTTISITPGTHEFKFAYDNLSGQEELTPGSSCTSTIDGFTNRTITVEDMAMTLPAVCWASCTECSVGLNSLSSTAVQLYPNPAGNNVFISGLGNTNAQVSVFNAIGSLVYQIQTQGDKIPSLDVSSLSNGVYFLEVIQNNSALTKKLVIQH